MTSTTRPGRGSGNSRNGTRAKIGIATTTADHAKFAASQLSPILLALGATYGDGALIDALTPAVAFKRFRAADVRSILATGAGAPNSRPPGNALMMDLPSAPTRSLDAYKHIPATDSEVSS